LIHRRTALLLFICFAPALATEALALKPVAAKRGLVVSSESHASEAGVEIMQAGGNAVDAAVAVGFALAVTHPYAGNLGGGGFMLISLASGEAKLVDYREEAPGAASRNMYLDSKGDPVPQASVVGALSVGVPGTVAGLALAEEKYGRLGLSRVMEPAIRLAEDGFSVSYWLSESLKDARDLLERFDESRRVFLRGGKLYEPGEVFKQPELGKTLRLIAQNGPSAFYQGRTAEALAGTMAKYHGIITTSDLMHYHAKVRQPLVGHFRGYSIVTAPPPSSGGVALVEMLNILEPLDLGAPDSFHSIHLMTEAMRRAYADRASFLGDADFVRIPVAGLTSARYAADLRRQILAGKADQPTQAGNPAPYESSQTTHYSVVDAEGNAVSNTYTLNGGYGSGITVEGAGFLLNNGMDDFAAKPGSPNKFGLVQGEANSVAPRKRPLSSMTPTIVLQEDSGEFPSGGPFDRGETRNRVPKETAGQTEPERKAPEVAGTRESPLPRVRLVLGSPGGGTIINTVLQVLLNVLVFKMDVQQAVDAPRFHNQWLPDTLLLEDRGFSGDTLGMLKAAGYKLTVRGSIGECQAIEINPETGWRFGAADPRGDGEAAGY
jgi:gamma-glutamyltranspeptidase / glutathione hydrolase